MITRTNFQTFSKTHYILIFEFLTLKPSSKWSYSENQRKSNVGGIRENPGIHPSYHFMIFPQNDNLGLKMKILKFLGIQPHLDI